MSKNIKITLFWNSFCKLFILLGQKINGSCHYKILHQRITYTNHKKSQNNL